MIKYTTEPWQDGVCLTQYQGDEETIEIPEKLDGLPVRCIGSRAFYEYGTMLEKIVVPGTVKRIDPQAFELCMNLTELTLETGLEELGSEFLLASGVEKLYVPSTVRLIERPERLECELLIDPDNPYFLTDGYGLYSARDRRPDKLLCVSQKEERTEYALLPGTRRIAKRALRDRESLKKLTLPSSLETIEEGALINSRNLYNKDPGITGFCLEKPNPVFLTAEDGLYQKKPDGLKLLRYTGKDEEPRLRPDVLEIERGAFLKSGIRRISIPERIRAIGKKAFSGCPLEKAVLEKTGTKIAFPVENSYLMKDLLKGFGRNGKQYDFSVYDRHLQTDYLNGRRVEMICCRLLYPQELPAEREAGLREFVADRMEKIVDVLAGENNIRVLGQLARAGFFTENNIQMHTEQLNRSGAREMMAFLMEYKNTHFPEKEFDFSL